MFITFSWIVWIQSGCASPLGTTFARFELIGHASNQVDCCSNDTNINSFFFLFFLSVLVCSCPSTLVIDRLAHQDMCGTREILKDENPLEHVTRLVTISTNFSNTRRVEQVRSCAHKTQFLTASYNAQGLNFLTVHTATFIISEHVQ